MPRHGVLIVGHGTRHNEGQDEFLRVADLVQKRLPDRPVAACFLELAQPTIDDGIESLLGQNVEAITVMPLLLFAAGHAKQDVPNAVQTALAHRSADCPVRQAGHLGCQAALLELSARRYRQCLGSARISPQRAETSLLLLGRGSHDASATQQMHQFAQQRIQLTPVQHLKVGFLAMASPDLWESAEQLAADEPRIVVVQPHLLFDGELVGRVENAVAQFSQVYSRTRWLFAEPLGPDPLLADSITSRILECPDPRAAVGPR